VFKEFEAMQKDSKERYFSSARISLTAASPVNFLTNLAK
jgi:hypothetical protein